MLCGVGFTSQGEHRGDYYRRTEASRDPAFAWVFDGIEDDVIGDFGLSGGGAVQLHDGDAIPYATIVEVHHPSYLDEAELRQLYEDPAAGLLDAASLARYLAMIQSS